MLSIAYIIWLAKNGGIDSGPDAVLAALPSKVSTIQFIEDYLPTLFSLFVGVLSLVSSHGLYRLLLGSARASKNVAFTVSGALFIFWIIYYATELIWYASHSH